MVGGNAGGGSSRRRSLDADINLVPFIDLLSMCICFLLMTAVWTQINTIPVKQSHGTEAAAPTREQYSMDLRYVSATEIEAQFRKSGRIADRITVSGANGHELSDRLKAALRTKLQAWGGGGELVASAMVTPRQDVPYGDMVLIMDALRGTGIGNIGVIPVEARYASR